MDERIVLLLYRDILDAKAIKSGDGLIQGLIGRVHHKGVSNILAGPTVNNVGLIVPTLARGSCMIAPSGLVLSLADVEFGTTVIKDDNAHRLDAGGQAKGLAGQGACRP